VKNARAFFTASILTQLLIVVHFRIVFNIFHNNNKTVTGGGAAQGKYDGDRGGIADTGKNGRTDSSSEICPAVQESMSLRSNLHCISCL